MGDISARHYYRKQDKLLKNFASTLRIFDLTQEVFEKKYLPIPYINAIYYMVENKDKAIQKMVDKRHIA